MALPNAYGAIQISTRALEITWAFVYASWRFYTRVLMGKEPAPEVVDLRQRADVKSARLSVTFVSEIENDRRAPVVRDSANDLRSA